MSLREKFINKSGCKTDCVLSKTVSEQKKLFNLRQTNSLIVKLEKNIEKVKSFHLILKIIVEIEGKYSFGNHVINSYELWLEVSEKMIKNGFKNWNSRKCSDLFYNWVDFYHQVFQNFVFEFNFCFYLLIDFLLRNIKTLRSYQMSRLCLIFFSYFF
jgi:hypothetical protein